MIRRNPKTGQKARESKKVIVAMSGGVDSSVAAALLKKAGFDVIGVFMKFWAPAGAGQINADRKTDLRGYNRCCTPESERRARQVARTLGIPFYIFNFEKGFKKRIVNYFLEGYKKGITPNPCVICNKEIKFGLFLEKALGLGADYVATGHYARTNFYTANSKIAENAGTAKLFRAKDKEKDQSYFLWQLNQSQLKRILFPIGDYTRKEVEKSAKEFRLPVQGIKKSVEICFVQTTVGDFLKRYFKPNPGKIIRSTSGVKQEAAGEHQGLWSYTIGQRKGIGFPGGPFYVLDKDLKKNFLIVTKNEKDLLKKELIVENVNWISGKAPKLPLKVKVKIRYRHQPAIATIVRRLRFKVYGLKFQKPQRAITPGQSAVFYNAEGDISSKTRYKEKELLGGGVIC